MKNLFFIIFFFAYYQTSAQYFQKKAVIEDLTFLTESIEKYNPALNGYHPEFKDLSAKCIESVTDDSISPFDYFKKVSKICALANEGHFSMGDWNDTIHKGFISDKYAYLPISVKLLSAKLYVMLDYSNEKLLKKGDVIVSINGINTEEILDQLIEVTPSDGHIETYAKRIIEEGFAWRYFLYVDQADTFELEVIDQNKQNKTVKVSAITRSKQGENYKKYYANTNQKDDAEEDGFYSLKIDENQAILRLPSFDYKRVNKYKVKSKKMYKSIFKDLKNRGVEHLVVDLRDNTGGRNEFADDMIPYIMKQANDDPYLKKTISWEGKERVYKLKRASKHAFTGQIFVLVNGKTWSAGSSLARFLKEYGNATIIGTETGTRYEGFAAGSKQVVTLPHSQVKIGIPRYHIAYPKSKKQTTVNRGLLPDYEIDATIDDYLQKVDLHMQKAESLMNGE
jgi:C-terminal processing protease CtpA/Prc